MNATLPELLRILEEREGLIPAWEVDEVERGVLSLFDVTATPAQVAHLSVERAEIAETSAALGHPPGEYASGSGSCGNVSRLGWLNVKVIDANAKSEPHSRQPQRREMRCRVRPKPVAVHSG